MFSLPILADELRVPLDTVTLDGVEICSYPGVVAIVVPLGIEETSKWNDAFPIDMASGEHSQPSQAATAMVIQQLKGFEGLAMRTPEGEETPFDKSNPMHVRSIPMPMRSALFLALRGRATLPEDAKKKSSSPLDSAVTTSGENTAAESAASEPETS